jgi:plastocyanin
MPSSNTKARKLLAFFVFNIFLFLFSSLPCQAFTAHTIKFGGTQGYSYMPNALNVFVGDTVKWVGDFSTYALESTTIPLSAIPFGPINVGDTFSYVVKIQGEYGFQCPRYAGIGMKSSFIALKPLYGLTNEGTEFYLAALTPSYNWVAAPFFLKDFKVSAFISTYYDNDIYVTYYDNSGIENSLKKYHINSKNSFQLPLDFKTMQLDTASDIPAYKACHIKSKYPISIQYVSIGACAGGSYLALPVLGLGKSYVAACYNDNPGNGAILASGSNSLIPTTKDYAGGTFVIIATENETNVKITPSTTTVTGHPGSNTGSPHPYTISLSKAQCYLVRSNGRNEDNDLSGSLIEATKPIAVISGNENAIMGGADPYYTEPRDFMIEQMTPVEYWDTGGYVSVPLFESSPPGNEGTGDTYRIYAFDNSTAQVHLDVQGIPGGLDYSTRRLVSPAERSGVAGPVEAYSTNGKKFALMQYDQRSQPDAIPAPAPSMVTVVPKSRWKRSYSFMNYIDKESSDLKAHHSLFINVIASNLSSIFLYVNQSDPKSLSSLTKVGGYNNITSDLLKGGLYIIPEGAFNNPNYFFKSDDPFMVYTYSMRDVARQENYGDISDPGHAELNIMNEYASPAGMQLNTGVIPSFVVVTQTTCSGWHICIRDTGVNDPGVKAAILIDDPDGVYWSTPAKYSNVSFDETSSDYADGELHPHFHSSGSYCFDVNFTSPLASASAPLAIVDNLGNAIILRLDRVAPAVKLSTSPITSGKADSIVFPVKKIGEQICTTFVLKNTAAKGGTAINVNSAALTNADTTYRTSTAISLPHSIAAGDSITMQVCYTPIDSSRHQDSLLLKTDCFNLTISLDAHGSTGLISAGDLDFKSITAGDTLCKNVLIKNVGSAPFSVTSYLLSDTTNYTVSGSFPALLAPNASIMVNICFHPKSEGSYSAGIDWNSDLESAFKHSVKDHTSLMGQATPKQSVKENAENTSFSIHPNPANGNSIVVTFGNGGLRVRPTERETSLKMYDVLGREVYHQTIAADQEKLIIPIGSLPEGTYYIDYGSKVERFVRVK